MAFFRQKGSRGTEVILGKYHVYQGDLDENDVPSLTLTRVLKPYHHIRRLQHALYVASSIALWTPHHSDASKIRRIVAENLGKPQFFVESVSDKHFFKLGSS